MPETTKGKTAALKALAKRRTIKRTPIDNSRSCAGSPMYFPCNSCGEPIGVPESYASRPKLCCECQALKDCGWLE